MEDTDSLGTLGEVMGRTKLARPTIYKWEKLGKFPRRVKCGAASRWSMNEVSAWIEARKAERDAGATA